jgi:diguanylate cyclase (GGDEF)-like protein
MGESSWLCDAPDRERLLEMGRRMRRSRAIMFALTFVVLVICAPWLGWWMPAGLIAAAIGFLVTDRLMERMRRPEFAYLAAWVHAQCWIAGAVALSGGPRSPAVLWLAFPVASLPGRFTSRGLAFGVGLTLALLVAVTVGVDPQAVAGAPELVLFPAVVVWSIPLLSYGLMRSDVQHRMESVVDPLTGMLNRKGLALRATELTAQSALSGEPVGVVLGDVDRFKAVNDEHGHAAGDAVLAELAARMRTVLRAYDSAYRMGGEEFLVLVPGATPAETADLAERLRAAITSRPVAGVPVTMSFGVAATAAGEGFAFPALYARADAALYEAKRGGRNRVTPAA